MINRRDKKCLIISNFLLLFLVLPFLITAFYANPSADDYTNISSLLAYDGSNFLAKVIGRDVELYMTWQGTFSGIFFTMAGNAAFIKLGVLGLRLELFGGVLIFFFTIWYLLYSLMGLIIENRAKRLTYTALGSGLVIFIMLFNFDVSEVFYWHTGWAVYTLCLSFGIFSLGLMLSRKQQTWKIVIEIIAAVCATGGALDISAFICGTTLLIAIYKVLENKKFNNSILVFLASFAGAIVNVAAPGNYVRHEVISEKFLIADSLKYAFDGALKTFSDCIGNRTIILVIVLCIALFNYLKEADIHFYNPVIFAVILFLGSMTIDFPVFLGYSGDDLPLRCQFIRRVSMSIFVLVVGLNATGWLAKRSEQKLALSKEAIIILMTIVAVAAGNWISANSWSSVVPFKIYNDLFYGNLGDYKEVNDYIIETLETTNEMDVVVQVPSSYNTLGYMKGLGLVEDPTNWVNVGIANYYGLNSVVLQVY